VLFFKQHQDHRKEHDMHWVEHVACVGQKGNACQDLYRKLDEMGPPGSPTCGLECARSIVFSLTLRELDGMDRIYVGTMSTAVHHRAMGSIY